MNGVRSTSPDDDRPELWRELERLLGYAITDENFSRALAEAQRRPIDRLYDELMATKARTEPGVLVRRGVGRVLRVTDQHGRVVEFERA
jgi:hypothetical protein